MRAKTVQTRERIETLLCQGYTNKEICQDMGIGRRAVTWYIEQIMRRLGLFGPADCRRLVVRLIEEKEIKTARHRSPYVAPPLSAGECPIPLAKTHSSTHGRGTDPQNLSRAK